MTIDLSEREGMQSKSADDFTKESHLIISKYFNFNAKGLSKDDREDLIQEIWITVSKKRSQFNPDKGKLSAWVYSIARNRLCDFYRKNRKQIIASLSDGMEEKKSLESYLYYSEDDEPSEQSLDDIRMAAVKKELNCLNKTYRLVLCKSLLSKESNQHIAKEMGWSYNNATVTISRAKTALRKNLLSKYPELFHYAV